MQHVEIVFRGLQGPASTRIVEAEGDNGNSIKVGEWIACEDGRVLRIGDVRRPSARKKSTGN